MKIFVNKILASPLLFGGLLSFAFYLAIHKNYLAHPLIHRYFAGHPVEYITTILFFVGFAILAAKFLRVFLQRQLIRTGQILPPLENKTDVRYAAVFLEQVRQSEKKNGVTLLTERLRKALSFVVRSGSAKEMDDELRYLADGAVAKADTDYGLVRLILWAVPMLGFLGTVIGITAALDSLDLNAINESSKKLSAGLAIAFDTTGLAIALDVALFFIQFVVYKEEMLILGETERLTNDELRGRFVTDENNSALSTFSEPCPLSPVQFVEALRQNAAELTALRKETIKQMEMLKGVLGSQSELLQLESQLRNNLSLLANVGNFEETVNSLAAAIHLLNSNRRIELKAV
ncbi:hypothetical protein FACS189419_00210 [Planctomycetales bacterium]|nr:hypothetical protein FACS189419_00210 [Planctomycetales bacterium]